MLRNKTKLFLLFSVIFVVMMGLSTISATDVDDTVVNSIQNTSSSVTDISTYSYTGDYNNNLNSEQTTSDNYLKKDKIENDKRSSDVSLKADNSYTTVPSETLTTKASGTVNGGLYHNAIQNPAFNSILGTNYQSDVSFTFVDSENSYSNITTARLYAVLYDNRDSDVYYINISVDGNNDGEYETVLENNHYITLSTTPDSTVYKLNDNITKVYTDYCLFYDITDSVNSETVNVEINSSRGAIKCIGLIVAYNQDDSNKEVNYWINLGSAWTNTELTSTFATINTEADDVNLTQSIASSTNPTTKFNNNQLTYTSNPSGYFGIESWNVTDYYNTSKNSVLTNTPSGSFKTMAATLALTKVTEVSNIGVSDVTFTKTQDSVLTYNDTNVTVVVSNDGAVCDEANITLTIDGESKTQTVTNVDSSSQNLIYTYVFTSSGVKDVSVVVDYLNGTIVEVYSGTVDVVASGYMGKSFTNGSNMTNSAVYDGYNTLNIFGNLFNYVSNRPATFTFNTSANGVVDKDKVVDVLYYQPWGTWNGQEARVDVKLNDNLLTPIAQYNDQKGFGSYNYPYGLDVYNITSSIVCDGVNNFNVTPVVVSGYAYAYGGYIVVIYANASNRSVISIAEDCDALSANTSSSYGATSDTAITYTNYNGIDTASISSSYVTAIANNANTDEYLIVNGVNFGKLSDQYNTNSQVAIYSADVTASIVEDNVVSVQCIKDTSVYVLNTILVVNYEEPEITVTNVKASTYSGSVLALENNSFVVNLTSNYNVEDAFNVSLTIGDVVLSHEVESISAGEVISLTFNGYLPTVAGDEDVSVVIDFLNGTTSEVYHGNVTVYYNGYMGKSFTNGSNMTNSAVYEGYNTVNVFVVSDYISSGWSEKSFVYDATVNGISDVDKVVDVLYYVPYTYSKGLNISLKVNEEVIYPVSSYVDLKGFGSYNYPYGLLVYNLTDVFNTGNNSIVLSPGDSNSNGLYGTYLIVVYENATEYNVITISEDCDMLSTTSSAYGATSDNAISFANYNGLIGENGSLIVIAGGSDNTVNVLFNNESLGSLGDYYNSSTQLSIFTSDISEISENNVVAVQSINDNLYTYNSILIVPKTVETKTQIDDITATVGETFTVSANVVDIFNNSLNGGSVVFTDENGNLLGESQVKNGVASIDLKYTKVSSINITATFTNTGFNSSNDTATITIVKKGTTIVIDPFDAVIDEYVNITARITDTDGNIVNGGKVIFKYNGVTLKDENNNVIQVTVVNGQATFNYKVPSSWKKGINLTAKYGGTSIDDSSNSDAVIIKASLRNASIIVKPSTLTAKSGDNIYYIIAVYDSSNHEFINGTVVIKMDGITLGNAEVIDGFAQFNYTIPDSRRVDNYTITVVFSNSSYNRVEDNSSVLTLEMREVYIDAEPVIVTNNETGVIKVNIRYTNNGEIVANGLNVAIKVNGVTVIKSTRCNNGSIEFTLPKQYKSGSTVTIVVGQTARILSARKDIAYIKI